MRKFFASRGVDMPLNNLKQAMVPEGYVIVPNALGTAPGYRVQAGGKHVVVLPGVPREMKPMMDETVLPWLRAQQGNDVYRAHTFQTFGISESGLDELVAGVVDPSEGRVSFRASFPEVSVRVVVHGKPVEAADRLDRRDPHARSSASSAAARAPSRWKPSLARRSRSAAGIGWRVCTGSLVPTASHDPGQLRVFLGGVEAYRTRRGRTCSA